MKLISVTNAKYIDGYIIQLFFDDGKVKKVNLEKHLNKPIFKPLKDIEYFKKFKLNPFTIEWDNGADFAPEYLYELD